MKAFPVLVLSLLLVSGVSAFASTGASSPVTLSPASIHTWIGKAANQLIQVLGEPSYTTAEKNGSRLYDYVAEPQHVGAVPTYQFVVSRDGNVVSAVRSY